MKPPAERARLVLADSSPLIALVAAGELRCLRGLFGELGMTDVVRDEVAPGSDRPGEAEILEALRSGWLTVVPDRWAEPQYPELDDGEASVIRAAMNLDCPCLLLIDERARRAVARELGFQLSGTVGAIMAARRRPGGQAGFRALAGERFQDFACLDPISAYGLRGRMRPVPRPAGAAPGRRLTRLTRSVVPK